MNPASELHKRAMELASKATLANREGDLRAFQSLSREAYEYERRAALTFFSDPASEPTRSVLLRSAASLAFDCGELREAERLIAIGLSGEPPEEIAEELRELFEAVVESYRDLSSKREQCIESKRQVQQDEPARELPIASGKSPTLVGSKVFISHAVEDLPLVEQEIVPVLADCGAKTWYCREDPLTADEFERRLVEGLFDCDWFVLVLSCFSTDSERVKDQVDWALHQRWETFVPVLGSECQPTALHPDLANISCIDFRSPSIKARQELLDAFRPKYASTIVAEELRRVGPSIRMAGTREELKEQLAKPLTEIDLVLDMPERQRIFQFISVPLATAVRVLGTRLFHGKPLESLLVRVSSRVLAAGGRRLHSTPERANGLYLLATAPGDDSEAAERIAEFLGEWPSQRWPRCGRLETIRPRE